MLIEVLKIKCKAVERLCQTRIVCHRFFLCKLPTNFNTLQAVSEGLVMLIEVSIKCNMVES
jgi:hypothetical protein